MPVAGLAALCAACLPIDRAPVDATPAFSAAMAAVDRVTAPPAMPVEAGAARVDMTPDGRPPLAGYGNRLGRPSHGVHDPLYARALALRSGDRTVILISLDLLAVTDDMLAAVETRVRREVALPPGSLILTATHTHSGFGAVARRVWESFAAGEYDDELFRFVIERAAVAAVNAMKALAPARMAWGEAAAPDRIANRMIPGGYRDPAVSFLAVERSDATPVAWLTNFSAHATVLKSDNFFLSGDYPGALSRALESAGGVALFTAGAVADQTGTPPRADDRFAAMDAMGADLAERVRAARRALPEAAWTDRAAVASWRIGVDLPAPQIKVSPRRRLPRLVGALLLDRRTTVAVAVIGDRVLIGVPCDLSAVIGSDWKARAVGLGRRALIVGFTDDYVGYVVPSEHYETSHYEARMSFNGPHMDRYLTAVVGRVLDRIGPYPPVSP
ncbi:MAG: neutral/alkaline non-lysosomal ceramidase N-terminal domain-containing protein [Nitrospirota bacterium]